MRRNIKNPNKNKVKEPKLIALENELTGLRNKYDEIDTSAISTFKDIPLSSKTQEGLKKGKYVCPTEIQRESIIFALQQNDILGAAKTGSGKTLAFLIPVLECLYQSKWTQLDGLGALIISPTRELAFQIFEVLRVIGKFHDFSAGLVIGGKHLREEAERINRTNIVICTPGRLLQHMDETVNFNADNLQILVLDEADRILDLGFQESMNAIIQNLPQKRQTLLFSATQTKSVKDLARLSLKDPMYVSVHENAKHSTPTQLQQSYVVCELHEKLDVLWSFVKNHLKKKILVFMSTCKQVRFVFEVFRRLRPGITVLSLHGSMQQMKRVATYESFCRKQHAVLFATDIAARGLDFPEVHWVVQLDCPEDANTYIHRAGRTARYEENGEALLILGPSEEDGMVKQLSDKKIPVNKIKVNIKKMSSIQSKVESLCASEVQVKEFAQRAFMSYIKSVFFMKNKAVFDVNKIETDSFARSLGLAMPPRIRFLQKAMQRKNQTEKEREFTNQKQTIKKPEENKLSSLLNSQKDNTIEESDSDESLSDSESESESETETSEPENMATVSDKSESISDNLMGKSNKNSVTKEISINVKTFESNSSDSDSNESTSSEENKFKLDSTSQLVEKKEVFSFQVDDDEDNLLTVKKAQDKPDIISSGDESDSDDIKQSKSKAKATTKAALAKKILKKKLKVNTKITFDDDGQEVLDVHKKQHLGGESSDDNTGGISLKEAKERMQEVDKFDKELHRHKIKMQKREKKIKEKEKRRAESEITKEDIEEPVAFLGSPDDDFNSEDEDRFDPDISGNSSDEGNQNSSSDQMETDNDSEDEEIEIESSDSDERPQKRKLKRKEEKANINKKRKKQNNCDFDTGLSLRDDEELALKLLQS